MPVARRRMMPGVAWSALGGCTKASTMGPPLFLLFLSMYLFGTTLGLLVTSGLLRFGPSFENIAWASLFFLAPLGCIYYPIDILPFILQIIAKGLPTFSDVALAKDFPPATSKRKFTTGVFVIWSKLA